MKPSSSDPSAAAVTVPQAVRAARFDRPLVAGGGGAGWGDPEIDRRVREAIEEGRTAGRAQGYAAGWAQGRQAAAETEAAEAAERAAAERARRAGDAARLQDVLTALGRAAQALAVTTAPAWDDLADVIADGALDLTRAILARELAAVPDPVLAAVRAAVRGLGEAGAECVVRLNPADLQLIGDLDPDLPDGVRLVADPAVAAGEVLAAGPTQVLRLSLPAAVAAAEEVLRG